MSRMRFLLVFTVVNLHLSGFAYCQNYLTFFTQDFPPFHQGSVRDVKGPVVDIVNGACGLMEIQCEIVLYPWRRAIWRAREEKEANGIFVVGRNVERESWLYFSMPIIQSFYAFYVPVSDKRQYQSVDDFNHLRVGVYGPSNTSWTLLKIAQEQGNMTIEVHPDNIRVFRMLNANRYDASFSNAELGRYLIGKLELNNVRLAYSVQGVLYHIGFVKETTKLKTFKAFDKALRTMYDSGQIPQILKRYKLTPAPSDKLPSR